MDYILQDRQLSAALAEIERLEGMAASPAIRGLVSQNLTNCYFQTKLAERAEAACSRESIRLFTQNE